MAWYIVYSADTGDVVSVASSPDAVASPARLAERGLAVLEVAFDPRGRRDRRWSRTLRAFEAVVPPLAQLTVRQFFRRFDHNELEDIFEATRSHSDASVRKRTYAFIERVRTDDLIDLNDNWVSRGLNRLETAGLLGAGRAAQILGTAEGG